MTGQAARFEGTLGDHFLGDRDRLGAAERGRRLRKDPRARLGLDGTDPGVAGVQGRGERLVHGQGSTPSTQWTSYPWASRSFWNVLIAVPAHDGGPGDFVAVQVEDGQHWPHRQGRVQELDGFPRAFERPRLRLAVPDDGDGDEVRVIEDGSEGVREDVAEFATFVNRAGCLDAGVARDSARRRELTEEAAQARRVLRHIRVDLGVGPFQVDVRDDRGAAMTRAGQVDHVGVGVLDQAVQVHVDEAESGRGPPVAQQPRLDVLRPQRLAQQGVLLQVDLADRQVVGRLPDTCACSPDGSFRGLPSSLPS